MIDRSPIARPLYVLALISMLAACGGGSSGTTSGPSSGSPPVVGSTPPTEGPVTIQGVATPSSVAVVTATNAG